MDTHSTIEMFSIASAIISLLGVIFLIYNYFRNPQIKTEKEQIKVEEDLKDKASILSQKEMETKALLLAEQVKNKSEETERRFFDMGKRLDDAFLLAANHTNSVEKKVDVLISSVGLMSNEVTRLSTIIEERSPKK